MEEPNKKEEASPDATPEEGLSAPIPSEENRIAPLPPDRRWRFRHPLFVRLGHWLNVLCLPILLMSGFQIFNAHPALYWGERSDRDRPLLAMKAVRTENGEMRGVTTLFGHAFDTTGLFGASRNEAGALYRRGFPEWMTLPAHQWLSMGRRWHFFFAWIFVLNGVIFAFFSLARRHLWLDLLPKKEDLRRIGAAILDHLRFRHPAGEEAAHYNVLQKIAYTSVVFVLAPLIVLTGLTMSPDIDAAFPGLLTLSGGRQSARTIHFIAAFAFIGYTVVHLLMVAITGLRNNLRSMVTGWYLLPKSGAEDEETN
ncbi:MAG: cytochrome b/b6 domain-containing protein [Nitrospirae bacterium]|nr:cytochrome b/b6 domain-containing protein [Candidatus Manganitrophaceae bacterium]